MKVQDLGDAPNPRSSVSHHQQGGSLSLPHKPVTRDIETRDRLPGLRSPCSANFRLCDLGLVSQALQSQFSHLQNGSDFVEQSLRFSIRRAPQDAQSL